MSTSPELSVPVSNRDHCEGNRSSPLVLVEYGDYECPYCIAAQPIIKKLQRELGEDLLFVFRNFPITQAHPNAELAAEAAEAAGAQNKFWQMHDALYENREILGLETFLELAEPLGIDGARFAQDLHHRRYRARVREDFMGGIRSGVDGTPSFFLNGQRHRGAWDYKNFLSVLKNSLPQRRAG